MFRNPITEMEYESAEAYVESLATEWVRVKTEQARLAAEEGKLVEALVNRAVATSSGGDEKEIVLPGIKHQVKVTPKINVTYPRGRGEPHPLRVLLPKYPQLEDMIRVQYEESGSKIQRLIDQFREKKIKAEEDIELAEALLKVRQEKFGKPGIVVEDRTDSFEEETTEAEPLY